MATWITVYDTGSEGGVPYVVSELITGESLRSVINRGPIARATALELALQLARRCHHYNGSSLRWTVRRRGLGEAEVSAVVVVVGDVVSQ